MSLNAFLHFQKNCTGDLRHLIISISRASKYVAHAIKTGDLGIAGTSNFYGEHQLTLDVLADEIFCEHLTESDIVSCFASEEQEQLINIRGDEGKYSVSFDPLDGSSLVDVNVSVGSIFGIWKGNGFRGRKGNELLAAGYFCYGPRTTFVLALNGSVEEFVLTNIGEYQISRENIRIQEDAQIFAPGNLRSSLERPEYLRLVNTWMQEGKTLRYAGGMVPDINSILLKGNGIFSYPAHSKYPEGKLRLLYECAPMAFIVQTAGGKALTEKGEPILDIPCHDLHDRVTIFLGSKNEVDRSIEAMKENHYFLFSEEK